MKIRLGFVTNSSSSSFVIRNKSNKSKTMVDFIKEIYDDLSNEFTDPEDYDESEGKITLERAIEIVKEENIVIGPGKMFPMETNSESEGIRRLLYSLGSGSSKNFEWESGE